MTEVEKKQDVNIMKPPTTLEEFLECLGLDDWPNIPEEDKTMLYLEPEKVINRNLIHTKLLQAAPLSLAGFGSIRKNIGSLEQGVRDLADNFIVERTDKTINQEKRMFYAPPKTFLTEVAQSEIVQALAGYRPDQNALTAVTKVNELHPVVNERCVSVVRANFPGIKKDAPTDLPNWIELPGVVEKIADTLKISSKMRKLWREIYLSQASIVLMQDSFWWIFLDYFKDSGHESDKDKLFDRMADTYVSLFFSIDNSVRDKFFQIYTSLVAQSIFLCFADAFPESQNLYDVKFKVYLADKVSMWLHGVKATPGVYKKWVVNSMLKADQLEAERKQREAKMMFNPAILDSAIAHLPQPRTKSVQLVVPNETLASSVTPTKLPLSPSHAQGTNPVKTEESLPLGKTFDFERVKFRLVGNSVLMDHHRRMHGIPVTHGPIAVRSQEVHVEPETTKTYADLIQESKTAMMQMKKHLKEMEKKTQDEIANIRRQYQSDSKNIRESLDNLSKGKQTTEEMERKEQLKQPNNNPNAIENQTVAEEIDEEEEEDENKVEEEKLDNVLDA